MEKWWKFNVSYVYRFRVILYKVLTREYLRCRDGSKCEVKCDTGFYVNETVKGIECKDGRSWHVDSGAKWWRMDFRVCLPKCSKPEDPKNGRFVCDDENCDLDSGNG